MIGTRFDNPLPAKDAERYAEAATWCNANHAWIVEHEGYFQVEALPDPGFDVLKGRKLEDLQASFNRRVSGSFTTSQGYNMQFDTTDAIKMEGAIKLLEATGATKGYLTQADDTTVYNVSLETMRAVLVEMLAAYAACHARKQELRAAINAAQSKEDLDEIIISWPI